MDGSMTEDVVTDEETQYSSTSSSCETGSTTLDDPGTQSLARSTNNNNLYYRWNAEIGRIKSRLDRHLFSVVKRTQHRVDSVFACTQQHVLLESSDEGFSSEDNETNEKRILFMKRRKMQRLKQAAAKQCPIEVSGVNPDDRIVPVRTNNTVTGLETQSNQFDTFLQFNPHAKHNVTVSSPRSLRSERSTSDKTLRSTSDRTAHLSNQTKHVEERRRQQSAVNFEIIEEQDDVSDSYPLDLDHVVHQTLAQRNVLTGQVVSPKDPAVNHQVMVKYTIKPRESRSEQGSMGSKPPPYPDLVTKAQRTPLMLEGRNSPVFLTQLSLDDSRPSSQKFLQQTTSSSAEAFPVSSPPVSPFGSPTLENEIKLTRSIDLSLHETPSLAVLGQQTELSVAESDRFPVLVVKRTLDESSSSINNPRKVPDPDGAVLFIQEVRKECPPSSELSNSDAVGSLVASSASSSSSLNDPVTTLPLLTGSMSKGKQAESVESGSYAEVRSAVLKDDQKNEPLVLPKVGHRSPLFGLPEQHSERIPCVSVTKTSSRVKKTSQTPHINTLCGMPQEVTGLHEECGDSIETAEICLNDIKECTSDLTWFTEDRPLSTIAVQRDEAVADEKSNATQLQGFAPEAIAEYNEEFTPIKLASADFDNKPTTASMSDLRYATKLPLIDPKGDHGLYTGVLVRETPSSFGEMKYTTNGKIYKGTWDNGAWHGNGQVVFPNGDTYTGQFVNDVRHGTGRYCWADGRIYDGSFVNNQREGTGTYCWPDGSVYAGGFRNGSRHGDGTVVFPDRSVYSGDWVNGRQEGKGECVWRDGRYYKGEWKDGLVHGRGVEVRSDGTIRHDGEWKSGRPVRGRTHRNNGK